MTVHCTRIDVDSEVLGAAVLAIEDFSASVDFPAFEAEYVRTHAPRYVSCKIPLERLADIHALERHGFELAECQVRTRLTLTRPYDTSRFRQEFLRVTRPEDLAGLEEIAATTFRHERFALDPDLPPGIAGARYVRYLRASFASPDHRVYRLRDPVTDRTLAFKTHRVLPDGEALLLLGGVHPDFVLSGLGVANTYGELNALLAEGVRTVTTHVSASNYAIVNLEIGKLGFRVVTTFAVMRKLYPAA